MCQMEHEGARASRQDDEPRIIHTVGSAVAATSRSSLELLSLPYPFSQVGLLTADEFLNAAKQRRITMWAGFDLDQSGLEDLHRQGIIVPLYCVHLSEGDPSSRLDTSSSLTRHHVRWTIISELYAAADDGRATDPASEPFQPWPSEHVRTLWPSVERGYLYSQHQLLGLERARSIVGSLRPAERTENSIIWRLDERYLPDDRALQGVASWRSLAITLSAIDTRAWPYITHVIHHNADAWRASTMAQEPAALLDWLDVPVDQLHQQSLNLRVAASFDDVVGDFYDLIRRAKAEAWDDLQGDARTAMDSRLAAEVLDRFADENEAGPEPLRAPEHLSMQGLGVRTRSLDAVLTDLHLSPHPPLVVALEGATEKAVVPRVMELLGMRNDPNWMRFVDFGGTKASLALLARFAAEPLVGEDRGAFVMLDRPVTRFLVLTDAENLYKTAADRRRQRSLLLDSIAATLPNDLRLDLYTRGARIVEVVTWGKYPFEFAHFTEAQLADALLALSGKGHPQGRSGLIRSIHMQRTVDPTPDIQDAWKASGVSKTDLANELWPLLEARIHRAIQRGTRGPPIMRGILRAYELAMLSYRQHMSLRRHPSRRTRR